MKYNDLTIESHKSPKRVGRGIAAGQGKTAGRGTKGQMARTGASRNPGFEGGQNPIMQRIPKLPGFRSIRTKMETISTKQIEQFVGKTIDTTLLASTGMISSPYAAVKLLLDQPVTQKLTVKLQGASATAIAQLEKAGGSFERTSRLGRPVTSTHKSKQSKNTAKPTK